ncbi:MAG: hypothetical protein RL282_1991 [Bacteroidota bacterium]
MLASDIEQSIEDIFNLYTKYGSADYIGEPVSQLEHMCQAAMLAEKETGDPELILAAFFHDIGHLFEFVFPVESMEGVGVCDHEKLAFDYLKEKGFSDRICKLVKSHVDTKRFLTYRYPEYYDKLSDASKTTLKHQGGVMSVSEALAFESDPLFAEYIQLREWDDRAKELNIEIPNLDYYKKMAFDHLKQNTSNE